MTEVTSGSSPLVSVVIPCFNHQEYVIEALESVFGQTYANIELIVVDDRSTDESAARIAAWFSDEHVQHRFTGVEFIRNEENLGAPASLNLGLGRANGEFISILNSDDAYQSDRLRLLVRAAVESRAGLLFTGVTAVNGHGAREASPGFSSTVESMGDFASAHASLSFALLKKNVAVTTGNLFFTRSLARSLHGFRQLRYCHDWDFALRACLLAEPVLLNQPLYRYRLHTTNSFKSLQLEQFLEPQLVYHHFFSECRAGRCGNPMAPDPDQWEHFVDYYIAHGFYLKDAHNMSGRPLPLYDSIAKMLRNCVTASKGRHTA